MEFIPLETEDQLDEIKQASGHTIIFKHNTTCPISKRVRSDFEMQADTIPDVKSVYFLDIHAQRNLSNAIAERFNVEHQSPQILLIKDGACKYNESRYEITAKGTAEAIEQ